jgi:hypothetical protein
MHVVHGNNLGDSHNISKLAANQRRVDLSRGRCDVELAGGGRS